MNLKLNALVAAAMMAASAPALAVMADATSGNGELLVNLRFYTGDNNVGGDDMSAVFDLGMTMDDFMTAAMGRVYNTTTGHTTWGTGVAGYTRTWNLTTPNYGGAWNTIMTFAGANAANIEYNVIALDNTNFDESGGSRYLTTFNGASYPQLANISLNTFQFMNSYVTANNARGTHPTEANGASTATSADSAWNVYFGKVNNSLTDGDNWANVTTADTTKQLNVAQSFWFLTTSSVVTTQMATRFNFGFDIDGDGVIENNNGSGKAGFTHEFGKWTVNAAAGTITYTNPVPEPETYAMMLAGLGLVGFMARRRLGNRV